MGEKPSLAIRMKSVRAKPAAPASRARTVGTEEQRLPSDVFVRYLYVPGELKETRGAEPLILFGA